MAEYVREDEFEERIVQVNRVSKKTAGGNKIGFSVLVVVGDKNGRVGVGLGKAAGVAEAIRKGATYAKKHLITVPLAGTTIPHEVYVKRGAAKLLLKPASLGTGVIAGGAVRAVVEAAGIKDILSKVLGTANQASNVYAALEGLKTLRVSEKEQKQEASKISTAAKITNAKDTEAKNSSVKALKSEKTSRSSQGGKKRKSKGQESERKAES